MLQDDTFISFAQNAEDVVLWRALGQVSGGRYVEVGANHPTVTSITRAFYERGWSGIEIEPVDEFAAAYRQERPRDVVVQAAVTDADVDTVTIHVFDGTGLSTLDDAISERHRAAGYVGHDEVVPARRLDAVLAEHLGPDDDIHFMVVDVEGAEPAVLATVDLRRWRPWVLVVESTAPNSRQPTHGSWEDAVLEAGYRFCLFDGLSRFYVAEERAADLAEALGSPASPLDSYTTHEAVERDQELSGLRARLRQLEAEHEQVLSDLVRWRGAVLARWTDAVGSSGGRSGTPSHEVVQLREELDAHRATLSWRITAPLRSVQRRRLQGWK